jgi:glyoxylase-like metal-dependent hydrolase (beta-lactamase superfamily II)
MKARLLTVCCGVLLTLSCASGQFGGAKGKDMLEKISENLYLFRDTCNVYVLKQGEQAVLIDFGKGKVLDHLDEIGVTKVAWVVHTHHHRDQCQGDGVLAGLGIKLAVPAGQAKFFENAEECWQQFRLYHNYNSKPDFFEPTRSVKVDKAIEPGESFDFHDIHIETMPCIGPNLQQTPGLTIIATVDGKRAAFCGDLIHSPGKIWNYYDYQWSYKQGKDAQAALNSLAELKDAKPDLLLPSHGIVMDEPASAIDQLTANWNSLLDVLNIYPTTLGEKWQNQGQLFPHVYKTATMFVIVADSGHAICYDTGSKGQGPLNYIKDLKKQDVLKTVDRILISHYHDDHVRGILPIQEEFGSELWIHESLSDVFENPYAYNIACNGIEEYPKEEGVRVDRVLRGEAKFEWEGYNFTVVHFPGQTEYHQAMIVDMDGERMMYMGDSLYRIEPGGGEFPFPFGNFNSRNYCRLEDDQGYVQCAKLIKKYKPTMGMAAHLGPVPLDEKCYDEYYQWAIQLKPAFARIIAKEDPNFGTDRNWAHCYPYRSIVEAGDTVEFEIRIRNHAAETKNATAQLVLPDGWTAVDAEKSFSIPAKQTGGAKFTVKVPAGGLPPVRTVLTANVIFDGHDYGELVETIIDRRYESDGSLTWTGDRITNDMNDPSKDPRAAAKKKPAPAMSR